jgi:hypothetical protein
MKHRNLLALVLLIFLGAAAQAQSIVKSMSSTNGTVYTVVKNAGTYYVGGNFTYVGFQTGTAGLVTTSSDIPNLDFPAFTGDVRCVISDGANGWFVGGSMYQADGISCSELVHVLSDNTIDAAFNVNITSGTVYALALKGTTLYVGGGFTQVNSTTRNYIAAVNSSTGALQTFNPSANNAVYALGIRSSNLYAGGAFTTIAGLFKPYFAAFSTTSGNIINNVVTANSYVYSIVPKGDTLFVGDLLQLSVLKTNT